MAQSKYKFTLFENIEYKILFTIWYIISKLPMWVLYCFSTLCSSLLYYVIRYRRKIVRNNIKKSFPNLSIKKRWLIERRFYLHFCDIFMESVKYFSISKTEIKKRMQFKGLEMIEESCKKGRSCGVYLGHYANWEWVSSLQLWIDPKLGKCIQIYHPLENKVFNKLIAYTRERMGSTNISVNESLRQLIRYKNEGIPMVIGFIADQVPQYKSIHYWTNFLNHEETPIFSGPERLMKQLDMDVYYFDVRRKKRGYYTIETKKITNKPNDCEEFFLTERYTRMLEHTIQRAPSYWLWSHNRWKRTKDTWLERLNTQVSNKNTQNIN